MKPHNPFARIAAVLFAAALSFGVVACGRAGSSSASQASSGQAQGNHDKAFVGLWEVNTMQADGELTSEEQVKAMNDAGYYTIYLQLNEDGSLELDEWGSSLGKGTWESTSAENATFTITEFSSNGTAQNTGTWTDPMVLKDGTLTFGSNDFILTFKRMETDNRSTLTKVNMNN